MTESLADAHQAGRDDQHDARVRERHEQQSEHQGAGAENAGADVAETLREPVNRRPLQDHDDDPHQAEEIPDIARGESEAIAPHHHEDRRERCERAHDHGE